MRGNGRRRNGPAGTSQTRTTALALGALGVVFGDIGTSPLYAMQTVFTADNGAVNATPSEVYGVISLVFWSITLIVSVKYVGFIMRADNRGEGGIMALAALVEGARLKSARAKGTLVALGIFGASLFFGDGVITPAISVLSAAEGLKVATPGSASLVLPITIAVLTGLFVVQRYGTRLIGQLFGPVMAVWFTVLGLLGIGEVVRYPDVLRALLPTYGVRFFIDHADVAFIALASVVLVVTGAEALYADMGHFGRAPIRRAWFMLVFPALTLNYLGQGSLILRTPAAIENPFYLLVPARAQLPMVVLATAATVIASQAVISGAFSVTRQAVQLGYLPRLTIRHTSAGEERQVYVPAVNFALFLAVTTLVLGFGSSAALASAYGVAVTATFILNTCLFLAVARTRWRTRKRVIVLGATLFLTVEVAFFSATFTKVAQGGWLPLAIGISIFTVMMTWRRGQQIIEQHNRKEGSLRDFVRTIKASTPAVRRVPGTAIFLNSDPRTAPPALRANVEHNHVLHQNVVTMSIQTERVPHVAPNERLTARHMGDRHHSITALTARFGYQDHPDVPATLRLAISQGLLDGHVDADDVSYFLSKNAIERTDAANMNPWRKRLYLTMAHNAASQVEHFRLPADRTVIMGEQIEI